MAPLRALIVSYPFPPAGGVGVRRVLKLAKYLPAHGVQPTILTVANPSVPLRDPSLEKDIPPGLQVVRAPTLEPGYRLKQAVWTASSPPVAAMADLPSITARWLASAARQVLLPDPQVLWQPAAQMRLFTELFRGDGFDVVLISGPPFSQFLLAPLARLRRGTAVVLDYRDEWTTCGSTYEMMGSASAAIGATLERFLLRSAHAITTATGAFRAHLLERFAWLAPERVHAITNGYDPDDFPPERPAPPSDRFVITYAGTVFRLTSARGFLGALRRLHRDAPELARLLEVRFVGRIVDTELDAFAEAPKLGVRQLGFLPHAQALGALCASHLVLCLLDDVEGAERIYPAKIFELMHLGRPCLTLAPPGVLTELVTSNSFATILPPRDEAAIAAFLADRLRDFQRGVVPTPPTQCDSARFDQRAIAQQFATVFEDAVTAVRRAAGSTRP